MQSGDLLKDISLGIIFSVAVAHLARLVKQPLILGYVIGGALLGPALGFGLISDEHNIEFISEIGLLFLLFINSVGNIRAVIATRPAEIQDFLPSPCARFLNFSPATAII